LRPKNSRRDKNVVRQQAWRGVPIPRSRDVRLLMPPSLPRGRRFETKDDARARNLARIEVLSEREPAIAEAIDECCEASPCGLPGCAVCASPYRIYSASEILRLAYSYVGPHQLATIYLDEIEAGSLSTVSLKRAHARLRKRLERSGSQGPILVGGTEVAWIAQQRSWILHVHLLAIGVRDVAWERLRASLDDIRPGIPLKVEEIKDMKDGARAVTYLTKFTTYHRPFRRGPGGCSRAVPLPPERLAELLSWWAGYRFEDFTFLFGARRRGGRIVPEI
jgi:hypothetical protein